MTADKKLGFYLREQNIILDNHFVVKDLAARSLVTGKGLLGKWFYILPQSDDLMNLQSGSGKIYAQYIEALPLN